MTASLTVCQSQPSSTPISSTVRPQRPTCSVTHRPARSVNASRGAAIVASSLGPRRPSHTPGSGTPTDACATPAGSAARTPADRPARPRRVPSPSPGHRSPDTPAASPVVSMCTNNGPSRSSTTPSTRTAGRPTSNSHMRVGSVITGALHLKASRTVRFAEPLCRARDPLRSYTPLISEAPFVRD